MSRWKCAICKCGADYNLYGIKLCPKHWKEKTGWTVADGYVSRKENVCFDTAEGQMGFDEKVIE